MKLLQNPAGEFKLLFILQRKSTDVDIENKVHNTTYPVCTFLLLPRR